MHVKSLAATARSAAQAARESKPVFQKIHGGAFDGRRPSGSRRRGETGGIEHTAVQHTSPEIYNRVWSSAGSYWEVLCVFLSLYVLTFQTRACGGQWVSLSEARSEVSPSEVCWWASRGCFLLSVCPSSSHLQSCTSWAPWGFSPFWALPRASSFLVPLMVSLFSAPTCASHPVGLAQASASCYRPPRWDFLGVLVSLSWFPADVLHFQGPPGAFLPRGRQHVSFWFHGHHCVCLSWLY